MYDEEKDSYDEENFPLDDDMDLDVPIDDHDFGLDEEDPDKDS